MRTDLTSLSMCSLSRGQLLESWGVRKHLSFIESWIDLSFNSFIIAQVIGSGISSDKHCTNNLSVG